MSFFVEINMIKNDEVETASFILSKRFGLTSKYFIQLESL